MRLKDKVAIVTGAGSGFGEGIAQRFAAEGAKVIVNDVNVANGEKVTAALAASGAECLFVKADVSKGDEFAAMIAAAKDQFGQLNIVVNNAGVSHRNQALDLVSEEEFDRIFNVNVKSLLWTAKHAVPLMQASGGGSLITVASTAGVRPRPGLVWYNGSKGAAITISKAMALELAPMKIRVNNINPVAGDTPLLATFMGEDTPEKRAQFLSSIPLGRFSMPADIANAALFFASDEAEFITGTNMEVDGGRCV